MTIAARFAVCFALLFVVSSQAGAFEWPHPLGHDVEGSFTDRVRPFGLLDLQYDHANVDNDGMRASRAVLLDGRIGAELTLTDRVAIVGGLRTGSNYRNGYVSLGGGSSNNSFNDNFTVSIDQLFADWRIPTPFNLVDQANLRVGRQPVLLRGNQLYGETVIDDDLNLDGLQLSYNCGCEDWDIETEGSVGGFKLGRSFDMLPSGSPINLSDGYETETARLITAGINQTWTPNEDTQFQTFFNYYHYANSEDGFNGNQESVAGIVDSPDILQAGINTKFDLGATSFLLSGEYIHNLDANSDEDGFTIGAGVDVPACDRVHRLSYTYQDIGAWSLVAGLAQDDHRDARTGYKGHVIQAEFNTTDRASFNIDAFLADTDSKSPVDSDAYRVRAGVNLRF